MTQQKRTRQPAKPSGPVGWQNFPVVAYTELDGRQVPVCSDKSLDQAALRALLLLEKLPPIRKKEELAKLENAQ